jgi:hypothetical protein
MLNDHKIVKCVIPLGSEYFIGTFYNNFPDNAIASNAITYLKLIFN